MYKYGPMQKAGGAGVQSVAWTPASISTLTAWYDAANVTETAGEVDTWPDASGNSHTLTPTANGPSYNASVAGINGNPSVTFASANSEYLEKTTGSILVEGTGTYVVFKLNSDATDDTIVDASVDNLEALMRVEGSGGSHYLSSWTGTVFQDVTHTFASGVWVLGYYLFNSTADVSVLQLNNGTALSGDYQAIQGTTGIRIARRGAAGGNYGDIDVAEIVITSDPLSTEDHNSLMTYFSTKYGLSL